MMAYFKREGSERRGRDRPDRGSRGRPRESFGSRPSFEERRERTELFDAVCDKCGKECQLPFKPSGDKPVYCRDCFRNKGEGSRDRPQRDNSEQLNDISRKLDKIMKALKIDF